MMATPDRLHLRDASEIFDGVAILHAIVVN
jgi:hypothetical protein